MATRDRVGALCASAPISMLATGVALAAGMPSGLCEILFFGLCMATLMTAADALIGGAAPPDRAQGRSTGEAEEPIQDRR